MYLHFSVLCINDLDADGKQFAVSYGYRIGSPNLERPVVVEALNPDEPLDVVRRKLLSAMKPENLLDFIQATHPELITANLRGVYAGRTLYTLSKLKDGRKRKKSILVEVKTLTN